MPTTPTTTDDQCPSVPCGSLAALSDEDKLTYQFGRAILNDPSLVAMLFKSIAGLGYSAQHLTFTSATGVEFPNRLGSALPNSEREGFMKDITDFLAKRIPREKVPRFVRASNNSRRVITQEGPSHPMAVAWKLDAGFSEAILGKNPRDVVPPEEIMLGSYLRGVVKITVGFGGDSIVTGSGVLIDDWTVATVGHLLVNDYGHAKDVVISAGQGSSDNTIEFRDGIYVAVHYKWYDKRSDPNDLAFIRLSKSFDTVNHIKYMQTPVTDNSIDASIYGFPYDMPHDSPGNRLCVSRCPVRYGQSSSTGMLEHEGDTAKGTSGGPVLDAQGIVIALHKGWAETGRRQVNRAVAIDRDGNDFWAFRLILGYMSQREDDRVKMLGEVKKVGGFAFAW